MQEVLEILNSVGQLLLTVTGIAGVVLGVLEARKVGDAKSIERLDRINRMVSALAEAAVRATEQAWKDIPPTPDNRAARKAEAVRRFGDNLPAKLPVELSVVEDAIEAAVNKMRAEGVGP